MTYDDTEDTEPEEVMINMNQKDKDKILTDIRMIGPTGQSDLIFFLIGYCTSRPSEFWEGCALFLHLDIK